jgi:WD40 repeat protein
MALPLVLLIGLVFGWRNASLAADDAPPTPFSPPQFAASPLRIPESIQRVQAIEFSPNGKYLASAHGSYERSGSFQIWEVKSGKRVALQVLPKGASKITWTPDGKQFVVSIWNSQVRVYDFPSLAEQTQIAIDRSVARHAISPDGSQIVTAAEGYSDSDTSAGRVVQIWDAKSGALVRQCDSEPDLFRLGCSAWSPKGKYVAAGGGYYGRPLGLARLWFADTGKEAVRLDGHTGFVRGIHFFPDDSRVATAGLDGTVRIWTTSDGKMQSRFMVGSLIDGLDISSDGTLLASGAAGGQVTLWSPDKNAKVADLNKVGPAVVAVAFSRDGKWLADGGANGMIRIWNVESQKLEQELPTAGSDDRPGSIQVIAQLAGGQIAVVGYDNGILRAIELDHQSVIWRRQTGQGKSPTAIAVSADQKQMLVGYADGAVRLHSAADGAVLRELKSLPARVTAAVTGIDGASLAAGDADGRCWLWDAKSQDPRSQRQDHRGAVLAIGLTADGKHITTIGADGKAICRLTESDEIATKASVSPGATIAASISADGSTAAVVGPPVVIWDAVTLKQRSQVQALGRAGNAVAVSNDGSLVVLGHALGTSMLSGRQEGEVEPVRTTNSREGGLFALSADQRVLLQGTTGGALLVWRSLPPTVQPLARIDRVGNAVALATSPDGKWLAAGGDDSQTTVWNLQTGEIADTLPGNLGTMYAMQFSPDSQFLAAANLTGTLKVWRVKDWSLENAVIVPGRKIRSLAFSPDGRWLATGGGDRALTVIDTKSWETAIEKTNQDHWVEGLAFSPDGSRLYSVTGSWDRNDQPAAATLTAWSVKVNKDSRLELEPIKKITAHGETSDNLVVTPDGRFVLTGSAEAQIKVWDARTLSLVRSIRTANGVHRLHLLRSDPTLVVLGDHVGGVSVWNIERGECVANYVGHTSHVFDVSATRDGRLLITAGEDDAILFWPGPGGGPNDVQRQFLMRAAEH